MRVRISDAALLPELLEYLRARDDVVVTEVGSGELEASVVGSYREDAHRMELELLLRAWQAAHPGSEVDLDLS